MDKDTLDLFAKVNEALQGQFSQLKLMHELAGVLTTKYLDLQAANKSLQARLSTLEGIVQTLRKNHDQLGSQFDAHAHITPAGQAIGSGPIPRDKTLRDIVEKE